jgi:hypothetical protein
VKHKPTLERHRYYIDKVMNVPKNVGYTLNRAESTVVAVVVVVVADTTIAVVVAIFASAIVESNCYFR